MPDRLAALLGSRICHDLISPLGAIANGLELLGLIGAPQGPEFELVGESTRQAAARIRLFRIAFGADDPGADVAAEEIRAVGAAVGAERGVTVELLSLPERLARTEAKLLVLLLLCAESTLPWGGRVEVAQTDEGKWRLTLSAERMKRDPGAWALLLAPEEGDATAVAPSDVHFLLAGLVAQRLGRRITVTEQEGRVALEA